MLATLFALSLYFKKFRWSVLKSRKLVYNPKSYD